MLSQGDQHTLIHQNCNVEPVQVVRTSDGCNFNGYLNVR